MLKRLTITFTEEERAALDRLAQEDMRPAKEQVRLLVRQEAQRRGLWLKDEAGRGLWPKPEEAKR